jgi:hypothetical protein
MNSLSLPKYLDLGTDLSAISAINNITSTMPPFPLLTQPEDIDESMFCNAQNLPTRCDGTDQCECMHRIKLKLNSIVEIIAVDEAPVQEFIHHPFHLHGFPVFVIGWGHSEDDQPITIEKAKKMMADKKFMKLGRKRPLMKDTISIPSKGFTVFRLRADNPGWWFLHCHYGNIFKLKMNTS